MGNSYSTPSLDKYNQRKKLTMESFQKEITRKMTNHILSNKAENCIKFVEILTNEKVSLISRKLKEKDIKKKINLYSFMNYKIYEDASELMNKLINKAKYVSNNPKSENAIYSEVIILLESHEINDQLVIIRNKLEDKLFQSSSYYIPFLIVISPQQINLKGFLPSKTFHYKFILENIYEYFKNVQEKDKSKEQKKEIDKEKEKVQEKKQEKREGKELQEIFLFIRKLNVLFSYYNELGDEFSFVNSEGKEEFIKIEDDTNITVYINIILLGKSGAGKSTLINLILDEKKSLEGGTGFSTTSKKVIVYKKTDIPIRFYDVKGMENEETANNYTKLLKDFNGNKTFTYDAINAIFYCIEYKIGTIMVKLEDKIFEEITNFDIPIFFIITKTPYDIREVPKNKKSKMQRENQEKTIKNAIFSLIKKTFKNKNRENEAQKFIDNYVKFYFVNLVRNYISDVPIFGIDKVLSFFTESVPIKDWEQLTKACFLRDEKLCKEFCEKNPFLKYYSDFNKLKERNRKEAENFLFWLKGSAFFSGMITGVYIGFEYYYKNLFKKKLKSLYGFDYDSANEVLNEIKKKNSSKIEKGDKEEKESLLGKKYIIKISQIFHKNIVLMIWKKKKQI